MSNEKTFFSVPQINEKIKINLLLQAPATVYKLANRQLLKFEERPVLAAFVY